MGLVQRMRMESKKNHLFFCTLTYSDLTLPVCHTSSGYAIRYANVKDVQNMIKRLRKANAFGRPFRYFGVSELGSKRGRPHFHIIWLVPKHDDDDYNDCLNLEKKLHDAVLHEWRRNLGCKRFPLYQPLCQYVSRYIRGRLSTNFDLHYVRPKSALDGFDDVAFYVIKYLLKPSDREQKLQRALHLNLDEDEYLQVWNRVKCKTFKSLDFGQSLDADVRAELRRMVRKSYDMDFPTFFNSDGSTWPLSRFYKSKGSIFTVSDAVHFFKNSVPETKSLIQTKQIVSRYDKQVQVSDLRGASSDFDELRDSEFDPGQSDQ